MKMLFKPWPLSFVLSERIVSESHPTREFCFDLKYDSVSVEVSELVAAAHKLGTVLLSENKQLGQEPEQLKSLLSVINENVALRATMQILNKDNLQVSSGIVVVLLLCH